MSQAAPDRTAAASAAAANRARPDKPATLRDMVVFRIYRAWSAANPIFTRLCEGRFNITRREWRILATSVTHGRLGSAALAKAAMLDSVRTSRSITALCAKGWLQRQRDTRDARNIYVEASPAGLDLYRRIMPIIIGIMPIPPFDCPMPCIPDMLFMLPMPDMPGIFSMPFISGMFFISPILAMPGICIMPPIPCMLPIPLMPPCEVGTVACPVWD